MVDADGPVLLVERGPGRTRLTLNRPGRLNAFSPTLVEALGAAIAEIEADPTIRAVSITGAGRAFSAGADLADFTRLHRDPPALAAYLDTFYRLLRAIETSPRPYVAAVNGACVAGGLELLLACDLAVAGAGARIGDGHLNFGQLPGAGGSQRLPRIVGLRRAKQLMLTGALLTAAEAERIGLVNQVVPDSELAATVDRLLDGLVAKSATGIGAMKRLLDIADEHPLEPGLRAEIAVTHRYMTTDPDALEGLDAFLAKRPPRFRSPPG
ncbi:MAG: enoyl-CoA hydratase-related protein [Dongiaceae bacterium]